MPRRHKDLRKLLRKAAAEGRSIYSCRIRHVERGYLSGRIDHREKEIEGTKDNKARSAIRLRLGELLDRGLRVLVCHTSHPASYYVSLIDLVHRNVKETWT